MIYKTTYFLLLSLCAWLQPLRAEIPGNEREALIALYNATDGSNWINKAGWLGPAGTECSWFGITCVSERVQTIQLIDNQLSGSIPTKLGQLNQLHWLYLSNNQLSGAIPVELGQLSELLLLSLSNNQLRGPIPAELGNLNQLLSLSLYSNQLSGSIPVTLGQLSQLRELILFSNQLSGSIPSELGQLSELGLLTLSNNLLSGSIPAELGQLTQLQSLSLSNNQLSGSPPAELGHLSQLHELHLSSNQLNGSIPAELGQLRKLVWLALSNNQLNGSIPIELGQLSELQDLELFNNQLSGSIPAELGQLSQLQTLYLYSNQFRGLIPPEIGQLSQLQSLVLSNNQLSDFPVQITQLTGLKSVDVADNCLNETTLDPLVVTYLNQKNPAVFDTQKTSCSVDYTRLQAEFIERFYVNILGRSSDSEGLAYWLEEIQSFSATHVAFGFFNSEEFKALALSDREFLNVLYNTIFGRDADQDGLNYWLAELNKGVLRESILYGFFQSDEFAALAQQSGVTGYSESGHTQFLVKGFVRRLYVNVLGREPDQTGMDYWSDQLFNGAESASDIVTGFFFSNEFINKNHDDSTFVDIAYLTILNRTADASGQDYWLEGLANGSTRHELIQGFIYSQEFESLASSYNIRAH